MALRFSGTVSSWTTSPPRRMSPPPTFVPTTNSDNELPCTRVKSCPGRSNRPRSPSVPRKWRVPPSVSASHPSSATVRSTMSSSPFESGSPRIWMPSSHTRRSGPGVTSSSTTPWSFSSTGSSSWTLWAMGRGWTQHHPFAQTESAGRSLGTNVSPSTVWVSPASPASPLKSPQTGHSNCHYLPMISERSE